MTIHRTVVELSDSLKAARAAMLDSDTICTVEHDSGKMTIPETPFTGGLDFDSDEPLTGGFCGTEGTCESCQ